MNKQMKSFLVAIVTIFVLMVVTFALTQIIDCKGIAAVDWILSPILVLFSDSSGTIIAIIIFLLVLGGISKALNECGFMEYMLNKIVSLYGNKRYDLIKILVLFFMAIGSLIGSFEEVVPLVPIAVLLSNELGFDDATGIGMSLLAVGCGFAAGVANPFTIGVAQGLAGLPIFSGFSLRLLSFFLIYLLLTAFLTYHAKKVAKDISSLKRNFIADKDKEKALKAFAIIMGIGFAVVLSSSVLTFIQDYTMIIIALMFLIAGITSTLLSKATGKELGSYFINGLLEILPSTILILMASSIRYTLEVSGLIDVLFTNIIAFSSSMNKIELILFVYLICLLLNAFIPSGSAKAFLLIPIIMPLASAYGLSKQLCILAYAFGDGFSNVLYPTNPALLISLGLANVNYRDWFKYSWKFQFMNLILTSGILILGLTIGY